MNRRQRPPGPSRRSGGGSRRAPERTPETEKQRQRRLRIQLLSEVDTVELEIEKLVQGGLGLGFWQRIPILVQGAAPGDRLRVQLQDRHPDYAHAAVLEILEPGPHRVAAPCPYYASCGGCDLQHIDGRHQFGYKVGAALEVLRRVGRLAELPEPRLERGPDREYRSRAQLHVAPRNDLVRDPPAVGFRRRGSSAIVDVDRCLVLSAPLQRALEDVRRETATTDSSTRRFDVSAGTDGRWSVSPPLGELPRGAVWYDMRWGERTYRLRSHPGGFFQGNLGLVDSLVRATFEHLPSAIETCWDLYAGVGLFSLPLADATRGQVVAVESDRSAYRDLRYNCRGNHRIRTVDTTVETFVRSRLGRGVEDSEPKPQLVVADPPRTGLSRDVRRGLLRLQATHLRYISCNPATLARDLGQLTRDYDIERLTFLDLFPQTSHLETVVHLKRRMDSVPTAELGRERATIPASGGTG